MGVFDDIIRSFGGAQPLQGGISQFGNIDVTKQPVVKNPDGSTSTVKSMSINVDGKEVLIPMVAHDGSRVLSQDEAVQQYRQSGKHLGIFNNVAAADAYAKRLHEAYESGAIPGYAPMQTFQRIAISPDETAPPLTRLPHPVELQGRAQPNAPSGEPEGRSPQMPLDLFRRMLPPSDVTTLVKYEPRMDAYVKYVPGAQNVDTYVRYTGPKPKASAPDVEPGVAQELWGSGWNR